MIIRLMMSFILFILTARHHRLSRRNRRSAVIFFSRIRRGLAQEASTFSRGVKTDPEKDSPLFPQRAILDKL